MEELIFMKTSLKFSKQKTKPKKFNETDMSLIIWFSPSPLPMVKNPKIPYQVTIKTA